MKLIASYRLFIFSVFIAFFLWFYVRLSSTFQVTVAVPIQVANLKEEHTVVSDIPESIHVLFEADGRTLLGLKYFYDVKYVIDAAQKENFDVIPGKRIDYIKLPNNVEAIALSIPVKDTLRIMTERYVKKIVPVIPNLQVSCAAGYVMVGNARTIPDSVSLRCPVSYKDSVEFVHTRKIELSNLSADEEVAVELAEVKLPKVRVKKSTIQVFMDIQPLGETVLENLPIRLINVPEDVNAIVQPSTFSIKIRGGVDYLASLSRDSVYAVIDYAMEQKFASTQPRLTVLAPRDVSWSQITPSRFNIVKLDAEKLP
jgi:hypothetical protein